METILLQQSDPSILDVATLALSDQFDVLAVEHIPSDFEKLIPKKKLKLVIVDFILDGIDALCYLKHIKQIDNGIPVIAMSCNDNISTLATQKGFDGYIEKPFDLHEFINFVKSYAAKSVKSIQFS